MIKFIFKLMMVTISMTFSSVSFGQDTVRMTDVQQEARNQAMREQAALERQIQANIMNSPAGQYYQEVQSALNQGRIYPGSSIAIGVETNGVSRLAQIEAELARAEAALQIIGSFEYEYRAFLPADQTRTIVARIQELNTERINIEFNLPEQTAIRNAAIAARDGSRAAQSAELAGQLVDRYALTLTIDEIGRLSIPTQEAMIRGAEEAFRAQLAELEFAPRTAENIARLARLRGVGLLVGAALVEGIVLYAVDFGLREVILPYVYTEYLQNSPTFIAAGDAGFPILERNFGPVVQDLTLLGSIYNGIHSYMHTPPVTHEIIFLDNGGRDANGNLIAIPGVDGSGGSDFVGPPNPYGVVTMLPAHNPDGTIRRDANGEIVYEVPVTLDVVARRCTNDCPPDDEFDEEDELAMGLFVTDENNGGTVSASGGPLNEAVPFSEFVGVVDVSLYPNAIQAGVLLEDLQAMSPELREQMETYLRILDGAQDNQEQLQQAWDDAHSFVALNAPRSAMNFNAATGSMARDMFNDFDVNSQAHGAAAGDALVAAAIARMNQMAEDAFRDGEQ